MAFQLQDRVRLTEDFEGIAAGTAGRVIYRFNLRPTEFYRVRYETPDLIEKITPESKLSPC